MNQDGQTLEKNFISAVVYMNSALDEKHFSSFLEKLYRNLKTHFFKYEIICVDDATQPAYLAVAGRLAEQYKDASVTILHMSYYQGIELAMNAGRDLAIGDFVLEFDECSWNFPEDMILQVYQESLKGNDIVCCADRTKRKKSSQFFYQLFNRFSGMEYQLESDNFRILSRRGINRMQSLNKMIPYRKASYANCGMNMRVLHYQPVEQVAYANDKRTRKSRKNLAIDSLLLFTDIGYRVAVWLAMLMAMVMVICAVYALVIYLEGIAIVGWTTTMLFLTFAFFGLFTILAIIIKYLSLLLSLNFKRQRYLYNHIEKL